MGIAALEAVIESDILLKGTLEFQIAQVDTRRMMLARKSGAAGADYSYTLYLWQRYEDKKDSGVEISEEDEKRWGSFSWEQFAADYEVMTNEIQYEDKAMENERNNLQTQLTAVSARIEGNEKMLNQNIEKEFNYIK